MTAIVDRRINCALTQSRRAAIANRCRFHACKERPCDRSAAHLKRQLEDYMMNYPKVRIIRASKREGLIRARLLGAAAAKAPVLTYLDSHCECTEGWLEPLLDRIARDPTTVVCPVIDVIDDTTLEYHWRDSGGVNVGGFDWNLQVNWRRSGERDAAMDN
jgi:polypeptide N-acetylgalactosaminyltransferase